MLSMKKNNNEVIFSSEEQWQFPKTQKDNCGVELKTNESYMIEIVEIPSSSDKNRERNKVL